MNPLQLVQCPLQPLNHQDFVTGNQVLLLLLDEGHNLKPDYTPDCTMFYQILLYVLATKYDDDRAHF